MPAPTYFVALGYHFTGGMVANRGDDGEVLLFKTRRAAETFAERHPNNVARIVTLSEAQRIGAVGPHLP